MLTEQTGTIGTPTSITRMKDSETKIAFIAPKGTILELHEYFYDPIGLSLGLVFDRTKSKGSKHFIRVNNIDIYTPPK